MNIYSVQIENCQILIKKHFDFHLIFYVLPVKQNTKKRQRINCRFYTII